VLAAAFTTRGSIGEMRNKPQAALPRITRPISRLRGLAAISCAIAVSACAPNSPQLESRPEPIQTAAAVPAHSEPRICQPDRVLLAPLPVPDCSFKRSELKTVDPDGWARLKVEYERQCYRNAEKVVRERLRLLQAAVRCNA
jgi:hypothetical protein